MFGFLRRKPEPEPVEAKGGPWTLDDVVAGSKPKPEHVVTPTGQPGVYLHTFHAPPQTDAQRQAAEDAAIRAFDDALSPGLRLPPTRRKPSVFDRPVNPDSFPS